MEESKKSMPTWAVVFLSVLGTCLVGFCVLYGVGFFRGEPEEPKVPENQSQTAVEDVILSRNEIVGLLSETEKSTNFSNLTKTYKGINFVFSCFAFDDVEFESGQLGVDYKVETKKVCYETKLNIENKVNIVFSLWNENASLVSGVDNSGKVDNYVPNGPFELVKSKDGYKVLIYGTGGQDTPYKTLTFNN